MLKALLFNLAGFAITLITSVAYAAEVISFQPLVSDHTRMLEASCVACHSANGSCINVEPSVAGIDSGYSVTQMLAFKNSGCSPIVTQQRAKVVNINEINLSALYFHQQKLAVYKANLQS